MNNIVKYIFGSIVSLAFLLCIALSIHSGKDLREGIVLRRIIVENNSKEGKRFMSESDVLKHLNQQFGPLIGKKIDDINLYHLELSLDRNTAIEKSQVYVKNDSTLHINILERQPILRFQRGDSGFYCDRNGHLFPLQSNYSVWVPIVDGNIPIRYDEKLGKKGEKWLEELISLHQYLQSKKAWRDRCNQFHIASDGQLTLCFEGFQEHFLFGDFKNKEKKLEKIEKYISSIRPVAEKEYKSVNVQFKGQIICK